MDNSLPKKRRRDREDVGQEVAVNDMEENVDRLNPASNLQIVCAQPIKTKYQLLNGGTNIMIL